MSKLTSMKGVSQVIIYIISFYTAVLILFDGNSIYSIMAILPIVFILMSTILAASLDIYEDTNIGYMVFYIQFFIKCVVAPLALVLSNYKSNFNYLEEGYVTTAVALMSYELIVCTLVVCTTKKDVVYQIEHREYNSSYNHNVNAIVVLIALLLIILWFTTPAIKKNYVTVSELAHMDSIFNGENYTADYAIGTSNRIQTTLFLFLFGSARIIIPFYAINLLKRRYDNKISFYMSILIVFLQFLFIPATLLTPLICAFILLIYMMGIFEKYKREIAIVISITLSFVVLLLMIWFNYSLKWTGYRNIIEYISIQLQAYFPGVCNVASMCRVETGSRVQTLVDTLVACLPFQSTIFGKTLFTHDLNTIFGATNGLKSQIVSTIGGGWYIFSFLFAPFFSAIFTKVSIVYGLKYKVVDNNWEKLFCLFMCIQSILGVGIYNIQTTITSWIQIGLVLMIMSKISKR